MLSGKLGGEKKGKSGEDVAGLRTAVSQSRTRGCFLGKAQTSLKKANLAEAGTDLRGLLISPCTVAPACRPLSSLPTVTTGTRRALP